MLFEDRKLEPHHLTDMVSCAAETLAPYSLLLAPAYIYMKVNDRVVSVKAPLDFFTPDELARVKRYETIYFPKFVQSSIHFQTAARLIKKILASTEGQGSRAPYELIREVNLALSELWFNDIRVEPFFAAVFAHEVCGPLQPEKILWAREEAVVRHDHGLLLSGMFVFVAMQVGWINLAEVTQCRDEIYDRTVKGEDWIESGSEMDSIVVELNQMIVEKNEISLSELFQMKSEWARLLAIRLKSLYNKLSSKPEKSPSIFGPEGFVG